MTVEKRELIAVKKGKKKNEGRKKNNKCGQHNVYSKKPFNPQTGSQKIA